MERLVEIQIYKEDWLGQRVHLKNVHIKMFSSKVWYRILITKNNQIETF